MSDEPEEVEIWAFGHRFRELPGLAEDLITLEREAAIYSDFWDDDAGTFRFYKIRLLPNEIFQYVEAHVARQKFHEALQQGASFEEALAAIHDAQMAERVRSYGNYGRTKLKDGTVVDIRGCAASFYPPEMEALVCGARRDRYELLPNLQESHRTSLLINILDSFPIVAKRLQKRSHGRASFAIENEYDVQDLLFVAIRSIFDDARTEEWTPQLAGRARRIDVVVPAADAVVEVKYVRDARHAKTVVDELMVDIESYHAHPHCEKLLVLVWDPQGHIADPVALGSDLSGLRVKGTHHFHVHVLVRR